MGMFDYIEFTCPKCGKHADDQTKVGHCMMDTFNLDMPMDICEAEMLLCSGVECNHCGQKFVLSADLPTYKVKMTLEEIE